MPCSVFADRKGPYRIKNLSSLNPTKYRFYSEEPEN